MVKNKKHEQFAHNVLKDKTLKEAYKNTYNVEDGRPQASNLMKRKDIQQRVQELLEDKAPLDKVIDNVVDLSRADKMQVVDKKLVSVQDNQTRTENNKILLKLWGADQTVVAQDNRSVHITINKEDSNTLETIANTLKDMNQILDMNRDIQDGEIVDDFGDGDGGV